MDLEKRNNKITTQSDILLLDTIRVPENNYDERSCPRVYIEGTPPLPTAKLLHVKVFPG